MDQEPEGYAVAIEELGQTGLWSHVKEAFDSSLPLRNVLFANKLGKVNNLSTLNMHYMMSTDRRLQDLKRYGNSAAVWWMNPYAYIILMCTVDMNTYKAQLKPAAQKLIQDIERDAATPGGTPEWMILYIKPPTVDAYDKLVKRVFDKIVDDFSNLGNLGVGPPHPSRRMLSAAQRVVRVDWQHRGSGPMPTQALPFLTPPAQSAASSFLAAFTGVGSAAPPPPPPLPPPPQFSNQGLQSAASKSSSASTLQTVSTSGSISASASASTHQSDSIRRTAMLASAQHAAAGVVGHSTGIAGAGNSSLEIVGMEEYEKAMKECIRCSFETRQQAYVTSIQQLLARRFEPGWLFSQLFLMKDGFAQQLESAGLWSDALQESVELEAVFLEALEKKTVATRLYDATSKENDISTLVSLNRKVMRRSILREVATINELTLRQYMFTTQARMLLRMGRPVDIAQRGLVFIKAVAARIESRQRQDSARQLKQQTSSAGKSSQSQRIPPHFKEAWTFSACLALANYVVQAVNATVAATSYDADMSDVKLPSESGANTPRGLRTPFTSRAQSSVQLTDMQAHMPTEQDRDSALPGDDNADVSGNAAQAAAATKLRVELSQLATDYLVGDALHALPASLNVTAEGRTVQDGGAVAGQHREGSEAVSVAGAMPQDVLGVSRGRPEVDAWGLGMSITDVALSLLGIAPNGVASSMPWMCWASAMYAFNTAPDSYGQYSSFRDFHQAMGHIYLLARTSLLDLTTAAIKTSTVGVTMESSVSSQTIIATASTGNANHSVAMSPFSSAASQEQAGAYVKEDPASKPPSMSSPAPSRLSQDTHGGEQQAQAAGTPAQTRASEDVHPERESGTVPLSQLGYYSALIPEIIDMEDRIARFDPNSSEGRATQAQLLVGALRWDLSLQEKQAALPIEEDRVDSRPAAASVAQLLDSVPQGFRHHQRTASDFDTAAMAETGVSGVPSPRSRRRTMSKTAGGLLHAWDEHWSDVPLTEPEPADRTSRSQITSPRLPFSQATSQAPTTPTTTAPVSHYHGQRLQYTTDNVSPSVSSGGYMQLIPGLPAQQAGLPRVMLTPSASTALDDQTAAYHFYPALGYPTTYGSGVSRSVGVSPAIGFSSMYSQPGSPFKDQYHDPSVRGSAQGINRTRSRAPPGFVQGSDLSVSVAGGFQQAAAQLQLQYGAAAAASGQAGDMLGGLRAGFGVSAATLKAKLDSWAHKVTSVFTGNASNASGAGGARRASADFFSEHSAFGSESVASTRPGTPRMSETGAARSLPAHLSWISEKRLQTCLLHQQACETLLLQLGLLAMGCFLKGGRSRCAGLIAADVSLLLLKREQYEAALTLLQIQAASFEQEGWLFLQGVLLFQVLHVQQELKDPALPYTCLTYLRLPEDVVRREDRLSVQRLLSNILEQPHTLLPLQQQQQHTEHNLHLPCHGVIQACVPPSNTSTVIGPAEDAVQCLLPAQEAVDPDESGSAFEGGLVGLSRSGGLQTDYSSFLHPTPKSDYELLLMQAEEDEEGRAQQDIMPHQSLGDQNEHHSTPQHAACKAGGAKLLCVGQSVLLEVQVTCNLPAPVRLYGATLTLACVQPTEVQVDADDVLRSTRQTGFLTHAYRNDDDDDAITDLDDLTVLDASAHVPHARDLAPGGRHRNLSGPGAGVPAGGAAKKRRGSVVFSPRQDGASQAGRAASSAGRTAGIAHGRGVSLDAIAGKALISGIDATGNTPSSPAVITRTSTGSRLNASGAPNVPNPQPGLTARQPSRGAAALAEGPAKQHTAGSRTIAGLDDVMSSSHVAVRDQSVTVRFADRVATTGGAAGDDPVPRDGTSRAASRAVSGFNQQPASTYEWQLVQDVTTSIVVSVAQTEVSDQLVMTPSVVTTLQQHDGGHVLMPGKNKITFSVSPTNPGLYYIKGLALNVGQGCWLHCGLGSVQGNATVGSAISSDPTHNVCLVVRPPQPALDLACVASGGSLVVGAPFQWLGMVVAPSHASALPFHHLRVHLSTPQLQSIRIHDHPKVSTGNAGLLQGANLAMYASGGHVDQSGGGGGVHGLLSEQSSIGGYDEMLLMSGKYLGGSGAAQASSGLQAKNRRVTSRHSNFQHQVGISAAGGGAAAVPAGGDQTESPSCRAVLAVLPWNTQHGQHGSSPQHSSKASAHVSDCVSTPCMVRYGDINVARALKNHALDQPMLLWLPVTCPQHVQDDPADVTILPAGHVVPTSNKTDGGANMSGVKVNNANSEGMDAATNVLHVSLEYSGSDGVWHSQETQITLTTRRAFVITPQARVLATLDGGSMIILVLHLQYNGEQPIVLQELDLDLQSGVEVTAALWGASVPLPHVMMPGASISLAWQLRETRGRQNSIRESLALSMSPDQFRDKNTSRGLLTGIEEESSGVMDVRNSHAREPVHDAGAADTDNLFGPVRSELLLDDDGEDLSASPRGDHQGMLSLASHGNEDVDDADMHAQQDAADMDDEEKEEEELRQQRQQQLAAIADTCQLLLVYTTVCSVEHASPTLPMSSSAKSPTGGLVVAGYGRTACDLHASVAGGHTFGSPPRGSAAQHAVHGHDTNSGMPKGASQGSGSFMGNAIALPDPPLPVPTHPPSTARSDLGPVGSGDQLAASAPPIMQAVQASRRSTGHAVDTAAAIMWPATPFKWQFKLSHMQQPRPVDDQKSIVLVKAIAPSFGFPGPQHVMRLGRPVTFMWHITRVTGKAGNFSRLGRAVHAARSSVGMQDHSRQGHKPLTTLSSGLSAELNVAASDHGNSPPSQSLLLGEHSTLPFFKDGAVPSFLLGASQSSQHGTRQGPSRSLSHNATEHLQYEVQVLPDAIHGAASAVRSAIQHWHVLSKGHGRVYLGGNEGSVATVQVQLLPVSPGAAPIPRLVLQGPGLKQVDDDSSCVVSADGQAQYILITQ